MRRYSGITVAAIVFYPPDKILLIKRDTLPFKGYWALPGGRKETDETVEQACVREVKEETGLDVEIAYKIGHYHEQGSREGIEYNYYPTCFAVKILGGQIVRQKSEVQEIKSFRLNELPMPLAFEHDQMIREFKEKANL